MINKSDLDHEVAMLLNISPQTVSDITAAFIEVLSTSIVKHKQVRIPRLGKFQLAISRVTRQIIADGNRPLHMYKVYFSKSKILKEKINEYYKERRDGEAGSL